MTVVILMLINPICESVALPISVAVRVERVDVDVHAPLVAPFPHFHDVAEIVVIEHGDGVLRCDGANYTVTSGIALFIPSMHFHDFAFDAGRKCWTLIQIDRFALDRLAMSAGFALPRDVLVVAPETAAMRRLVAAADWLGAIMAENPSDQIGAQLVGMIIHLMQRAPMLSAHADPAHAMKLAKLRPSIDAMYRRPEKVLSLSQAASSCGLSPSHFSRRFSQTFGIGYAEYGLALRLNIAAQRIAVTSLTFAEIAYALGFASPSHFSARFRARYGQSPRQYRNASQIRVPPDH